jgi:hypothetical protein
MSLSVLISASLVGGIWLYVPFPRGQNIPKEPPSEKNRVTHRLGFSIVRPPYWVVHSHDDDMHLSRGGGFRSNDFIQIRRLSEAPKDDPREFRETLFQGKPCLLRISRSVNRHGEHYCFTTFRFKRGQNLFDISYQRWRQVDVDDIPPVIYQYLATFRDG